MLSIYKASAGSGKTYTLAREYIRLLLSTPHYEVRAHTHILAVTFTKKATAEMKERILKELYLLSTAPERSPYLEDFRKDLHLSTEAIRLTARERLVQLLEDYTGFAVSTIDGFFQQVVRSFARELGLPATYNLTLDADEVIERAVDDVLFAVHQADAGSEWLTEFALSNMQEGKRWNPRETMLGIAAHLLTERLQQRLSEIRPLLTDKDLLRNFRSALEKCVSDYQNAEWRRKRKLDDEQLRIREDALTAEAILAHLSELGTLSDIAEQIRLTNIAENRLPISDINLLLNRVIDGADTPFIYEKIGTRIQHYMIDEFQDTSILQWANFLPLIREANDNGRDCLIVGDTKQSIYRWRNSDWHILENAHRTIQPAELPKMDTNFRSSAVVVEANNHIFARYAEWAADSLDTATNGLGNYGATIRAAYTTLYQKASHQDLAGRVRLAFYDTDDLAEAEAQGLEEMIRVVKDATARGIEAGDIAVLVRGRKQAAVVTTALLAEGYDVQSAEGLLIAGHPAIETLICLLTLSITPDDDVLQTRLRLTLASHLRDDDSEALALAMSDEPVLSDEQQIAIREAALLPLYEQVQSLVDVLQLTEWEDAAPYITAFQDIIYSYTESGIADVSAFLEYWERRRDSLAIPSSPTRTAVQVMTVHKSKGLEFRVVIVPMLSWAVAVGTMDSHKLLWVEPDRAPFNTLPLLPVGNSKALLKTIFAKDYARELGDLYMDTLNLTYVAFTRAREELYAFGQIARKDSKGEDKIKNVGNLLSVLLREHLNEDGEYIVSQGEVRGSKQTESTDATIRSAAYQSIPINDRLHLRTHAKLQEDLTLQDFGTLMHDILSHIVTKDDSEQVLTHYLYSGRARKEDIERIREQLDAFFRLVEEHDWFSTRYQVLSEQDILSPTGSVYRPDRIMLDGQRAIILDYKFGTHRRKSYNEQVRNYMSLLSRMGYQPEGYLVYVTLNTIEEVS